MALRLWLRVNEAEMMYMTTYGQFGDWIDQSVLMPCSWRHESSVLGGFGVEVLDE